MLRERPSQPERMDQPDFGLRETEASFRFIEPVNRWLGGVQPMLGFFRREGRAWLPGQTVRILDVGCGCGDVALALARWGQRAGHRLQIEAVDRNPNAVALAQRKAGHAANLTFACRDALALEGAPHDYVLAAMFVHHFPDAEVPALLHRLLSLARRKVVVNDLQRTAPNYLGTWLATAFSQPVVQHDARLSVCKGFTLGELRRLLEAQGLSVYRLERHFFCRFLLILNREDYP
ncbi:MAG: methyltransferase domain-containing protein [Chloroflexi bacterium]|nr:methyltransferase domain-containing protein [Chloroflexota bacterium]